MSGDHLLTTQTYEPGQPLFMEGDPMRGVYYVMGQNVRIFRHDEKGNNIFLFLTSELVGLTSFFRNEKKYACSAFAGTQGCRAVFLSKEVFSELMDRHPEVRHELIKMLCARIGLIEVRTKNILHKSVDLRLTETLASLAQTEIEERQVETLRNITLRYSTKELAKIMGISINYLRKRLKELKDTGLIDYGKNWLLIKDLQTLSYSIKNE